MEGALKGYKFTAYCLKRAMTHPLQPISYYYCNNCRIRFSSELQSCPRCGDKLSDSPVIRHQSPVPWYGSVGVIAIGITCWILGASIPVSGLDEAGRALVYIPLGNLFGLSINRKA